MSGQDGTIECESEVDKGTTFTVVLDIPIADRQREDMRLDSVDVLVVDDDEVLLQTAIRDLPVMMHVASFGWATCPGCDASLKPSTFSLQACDLWSKE